MLRAVIIEDSITSCQVLENLLKEFCDDKVIVVGTAECYSSGIEIIRKHKPDVVFLDIELPGGLTGFDVLHSLEPHERNFSVIVTTDWPKYSLQAIKEQVVDFILKPIDIDELVIAVEKASLDRQKESAFERTRKNTLLLGFVEASQTTAPHIILRHNKTDVVVALEDILYCESEHKYTVFHTLDSGPIRMRKNLGDYEEFLLQRGFLRISRSVILNLAYIAEGNQETRTTDKVIIKESIILTVTSRYREDLLKYLFVIQL